MTVEIPNWAVFRASNVHRGGYRLPKKTSPYMPRPNAWPTHEKYQTSGARNLVHNHMQPYTGPSREEIKNYLTAGDYRNWGGAENSHCYGSCRGCGQVIFDRDKRGEHRRLGCGHKLENAFKLLKRDPACIICGEKTHQKHWGLPICSKDCQHHFQYVEVRPAALIAAFKLLEKR